MELKDLKNAWLSPTGEIVITAKEFSGYDGGWHDQLAYCILRDIWGYDSFFDAFNRVHKKFSAYGYTELEDLGWIRLHGFGGLPPKFILPHKKTLTKKQENTILDWCNANNVKYEDSLAK